jgi:hypothetical protein
MRSGARRPELTGRSEYSSSVLVYRQVAARGGAEIVMWIASRP